MIAGSTKKPAAWTVGKLSCKGSVEREPVKGFKIGPSDFIFTLILIAA